MTSKQFRAAVTDTGGSIPQSAKEPQYPLWQKETAGLRSFEPRLIRHGGNYVEIDYYCHADSRMYTVNVKVK